MEINLHHRSYLCDILQQGHSCYLPLNHTKRLQLAAKLNSCGGMFYLEVWEREEVGGSGRWGGGGGREYQKI